MWKIRRIMKKYVKNMKEFAQNMKIFVYVEKMKEYVENMKEYVSFFTFFFIFLHISSCFFIFSSCFFIFLQKDRLLTLIHFKFVDPFAQGYPNVKERSGIPTKLKGEFNGKIEIVEVNQKTLNDFHRSDPKADNGVHIPQLVDDMWTP